MFRFLATDLDGTLLTSAKTITPYSQQVLIEAQRRGLTIILASGRPLCSMLPFAEQLELPKYHGYIIAYNGSLVWDCAAGRIIREWTIPLCIIPQLAQAVGDDFHIHGYKDDTIIVRGTPDSGSKYIARANRMPLIEATDFTAAITDPQHKCIITGPPRKLWHLERRLLKQFESSLSIFRSESFLLEVVPKGIDKAEALREVLTLAGSKAGISSASGQCEELICCGDGYNDLNMMRLGGISCATRNAKKPVKAAASHVTESNDRDGVANAVVRYI